MKIPETLEEYLLLTERQKLALSKKLRAKIQKRANHAEAVKTVREATDKVNKNLHL